jgi:phosphorylase kinase alpha/beta subunit
MTIEFVQTSLAYLKANWEMSGRPTITLPVTRFLLGEQGRKSPVMSMLQKLRSGYSAGVRTQVGKLADFLKTSHITKLSFMHGYRIVHDVLGSPQLARKVSFETSNTLLPSDQETMPSPRLGKRSVGQSQAQIRKRSASLASGSVRRSRRAASGYLEDMFGAKGSPKSVMDWLAQGGQGSRKRSLWLKEISSPAPFSPRNASSGTYGGVELTDLLEQLAGTNLLQDQADILHFLYLQKGLKFDCKLNGEEGCTVEVLLEEVYTKAAHEQMWSLVRHTAGMVGKQVEELAAAATDILVHQKQFTIGLPPLTFEVTRWAAVVNIV